jgi:hypothetical protein
MKECVCVQGQKDHGKSEDGVSGSELVARSVLFHLVQWHRLMLFL